jgi:L,D-peptidoglycan transpeptidase YkuD (ErfK/YbiS/YcfS/YnhG family)
MQNIQVLSTQKVLFNGKEYPCAIGRGGISENKKEGDGTTPAGCFPIRKVFYRADRVDPPKTSLEIEALKKSDGWCDGVDDPNYNMLVTLPYPASSENLWRDDHVYDVIVVLGYNDEPAIPGKGSAIFMHVAREGYTPTAGCIALTLTDLLEVLLSTNAETLVCVSKD